MTIGHPCHRRNLAAAALAAAIAAGLCTCNNLAADGGFGSETTNGRISGHVVLPGGSPAVAVQVTVRRNDYVTAVPNGLTKKWV